MKRFLCLFMATLACFSTTCFAANKLKDISNTKYEDAVDNLVSFEIVNGFEDNTFRPSEKVTRAQLSKMIVLALGKQGEVESAKKKFLNFSDVLSSHWGYGYVKLASDNNIVNGYTDGKFLPDGNVTYAEATAMVIRALEFDEAVKQSELNWPDNYISFANDKLKLYTGISTFKASDKATRGDIAILIWNALRTGVAEITSTTATKVNYTPGEPLITKALNCIYLKDAEVTDIDFDDNYKTAEVTFMCDKKKYEYDFDVEEALNMFGCKVSLLYDKKNKKMINFEKDSEYNEIKGEISNVTKTKIYLSNKSTGYSLPEDEEDILLFGIESLDEAVNAILYVSGTKVKYMVASGASSKEVLIGIVIDNNTKIDDEYGVKVRKLNESKGGEKYLLADDTLELKKDDIILYYVNSDDLIIVFDKVNQVSGDPIKEVESKYIKVNKKVYEFETTDDYTVAIVDGSKVESGNIKDIDKKEDTIKVIDYNAHYYFIVFEDGIRDSISDDVLNAYDDLQYMIEEAYEIDKSKWTAKSYDALMNIVKDAEELDYDTSITKLKKASTNIENAIDDLVKASSSSSASSDETISSISKKLRRILEDESEDIIDDKKLYTSKSYKAFKEIYDEALEVYEDDDATLKELKNAYNDLADAIDNLVEIDDEDDIKSAREDLEELLDGDAETIWEDEKKYTTKSFENFSDAYDEACEIVDDKDATLKELENAYYDLEDAIDDLVKK